MSAQTVYSPETELEAAITGLLTSAFTALSTNDPQTFQKNKPRVEVMCQLGASRNAHLAMAEVTGLGNDAEDSWSMNVTVTILTEASIDVHDSCRAVARFKMGQLPSLINGITLLNHAVFGPIRHQSTAMQLSPNESFYKSTMQYVFDILVHGDAWAKINQQ